MTLTHLKALEDETVEKLRGMVANGDSAAAGVLLSHLRQVSKDISEWQRAQDVLPKPARSPRKTTK